MLKEMMYAHALTVSDLTIKDSFDSTGGNEGQLVGLILSWLTYLVGALAFIYLIYAGILYITAGGNADQAKKGSQGILYAIIGIVIAILASTFIAVIVNTVKIGM